MVYGDFWSRVIAFLIDIVVVNVVGFIVGLVIGFIIGFILGFNNISIDSGMVIVVEWLINIAVAWLYFTLFETSKWQATPGKKLLGLAVVDMDGGRITFGRANVRSWSKILSFLIAGIGCFMIAFTQKKQGLHDILAKTLVIKK